MTADRRPTSEFVQDDDQSDRPSDLPLENPAAMTLRGVRKELGRTQVEVAREAGMSQGDLSRLERRKDHLLSTLERYAQALGGRLEIALVRDDKRFPLEFGR